MQLRTAWAGERQFRQSRFSLTSLLRSSVLKAAKTEHLPSQCASPHEAHLAGIVGGFFRGDVGVYVGLNDVDEDEVADVVDGVDREWVSAQRRRCSMNSVKSVMVGEGYFSKRSLSQSSLSFPSKKGLRKWGMKRPRSPLT